MDSLTPDDPAAPRRRVLVAVSDFERENLLAACFDRLRDLAGAVVTIHRCEGSDDGAWEQTLRAIRPEVLVVGWAAPLLPPGYLEEPDCPVRYVCSLTGSVRRIVPRGFIERGGTVTNWGDDIAPMVAEHALLLLLAALRRLPEWRPFTELPPARQSAHPIPLATRSLFGQTVALHGFGRIARQFIRLTAPFGVTVRAFSDGVPADFMRSEGAEPAASLGELFDGAGILVECEALTPQTEGSVNDDLLGRLAPGAVFVNVGRGAVVDEAALTRRAEAGELRLALDVLAVEPLPPDSPLRRIPGAILSPHIAGPTRDRLPILGTRAVANLEQYLAGQTPSNLITTDVYDRST